MPNMRLYAAIEKTEAQDDGTIKVWGYASTEATDSDGEIITAEAMKAAIPEYMRFGAVREMHDAKKAAGTAIEAEVHDDGRTWFGAHVVDPIAVKKVEASVYKGFSIGGKVTGRDKVNKNTITGLNLIEVSLVDRPATVRPSHPRTTTPHRRYSPGNGRRSGCAGATARRSRSRRSSPRGLGRRSPADRSSAG